MNIPDFSSSSVLVAGDVMLDQYYYGHVSRISPEAPVPVIKVNDCRYAPGGAANVSNNIVSLGAGSSLIGAAGGDQNGRILSRLLKNLKIKGNLIKSAGTVTKMRIIGDHQQIARLDFEGPAEDGDRIAELALPVIEKELAGTGIVIISDYAKGFCSIPLCREIIGMAGAAGKPVIIDPKGSDWSKYRGAYLISPNLKELGEICGHDIMNEDYEIEKCGSEILKKYSFKNLLVTRSEKGMTLLEGSGITHIRSEARDVFDVSGAGDTAIAVLALGIAGGMTLKDAVRLSNRAAGIVVGKSGTVPIRKEELLGTCTKKEEGKIIDTSGIKEYAAEFRKEGKTVVFTNGCFDIIHRGHVEYLRKAKDLGDILIIGLNTDASVRENKGKGRPLNNEKDRAEVLSALEFVDYIVLFGEKTPSSLIRSIKPDVLVKGGDYKPRDVAGREYAGKTVIIPFLDGYSTTGTIKKIEAGGSCL